MDSTDLPDTASELEQLRAQIEQLQTENQELKKALLLARDATPIKRISYARANELAQKACMELSRCGNLWLLRMGNLFRKFRFLREVWDLLSVDGWELSGIFPPEQLATEIGMSISNERGRFVLRKNHMASVFGTLSDVWCHIVSRCSGSLDESIKLLDLWATKYEEHKRNRWRAIFGSQNQSGFHHARSS